MSELTEKLEELPKFYGDDAVDYMSDMKNWVCVHVTKYEPKQNDNGELYIETTGMATGFKLPRGTIHFALNQIVGNNGGGNWDAASIVVLIPYKDVVRQNGNPLEVAAEDTYFAPSPDTGLLLPDNTYTVRPDPNSKELFVIGEHSATYKTDNYTDKEIEMILNLNSLDKEKYYEYLNGDISDSTVKTKLGYNKKLIELYEQTKDKKAFMRGLLEEDRFTILNHLLRDYVTQKAVEKMGYYFVYAHENAASGKIADVACDAGLKGNSGNKGHSNSVAYELEVHGIKLINSVKILKSKNVDEIYQHLTGYKKPLKEEIIDNILSDAPLPDIYNTFEAVYNDYVERYKAHYEMGKDSYFITDKVKKNWETFISQMENGLKAYCPNLDTTIRRHAKRMQLEFTQALKELKKDEKVFTELKQRLAPQSSAQVNIDIELKEILDKPKADTEFESSDFMNLFIENGKNGR